MNASRRPVARRLCREGLIILGLLAATPALMAGGRLPPGRIVFHSVPASGGPSTVWVMKADGTEKVQLTDGTQGNDNYPRPSPDGRKVLFTRVLATGDYHLYVIDADGSNGRDLTPADDARQCAWSPDGTKIVFASVRAGGNWDIYLAAADGSGVTRVTDHAAIDGRPAFDSTGTRIYFTSQRDMIPPWCPPASAPYNNAIYACDLNGDNLQRLTDPVYYVNQPDPHPFGTGFICNSDKAETECAPCPTTYAQIFSFSLDGSACQQITHAEGQLRFTTPKWRRDGRKIVCQAVEPCYSGQWQLWTLDPDGSNLTQITYRNSEFADGPSWTWVYRFSGFLSPVTSSGRTSFKLGSVIPLKFVIYDPDGQPVSNAVAKLYVQKVLDSPIGDLIAPSSANAPDGGNTFRWVSENYQFNLSTKRDWATAGTWRVEVQLDDGTSYDAIISLR